MMAEEKEPADDDASNADKVFDDVEDGAGCAEIWEKLSDSRAERRRREER